MKNFIRKKEDFVCENCGYEVKGNGYTDHCPKCLWGKHVDEVIPGDRASECRGLMESVKTVVRMSDVRYQIYYRCVRCGHEFRVWATEEDDRERLVELGR